MRGFCCKNNEKSALTIYSDNQSTRALMIFMCLVPFMIFGAPWFSLYAKIHLFIVAAFFIYFLVHSMWHMATIKIPLLTLSPQGIKPVLMRDMCVDFHATIVPWDNIAQVFVYKAPFSYTTENTTEAGFRYIGIRLAGKNQAAAQPIVLQSVQTMLPYSNDIDIPLTVAHPFTRKLIKQLTCCHQRYLEQKSKILSAKASK